MNTIRDNADTFEARLVGYSKQQRKDGSWVECRFHIHPSDVTPAIQAAPLGTTFMIAAVPVEASGPPIADDETQADLSVADEPQKLKGGRLAKQAGIACGDKRFWAFLLEERNGDICIFDAEDAARHVKRLCGISSRAQLDYDEIAAAKWRDLHGGFTAWLTQ